MASRRAPITFMASWSVIILDGHIFYPSRRDGVALHELYEVSGLVMGDAPYEEYVPTSEELHLLRKEDPAVYETYWEVMCHFHICEQISIGGTGVLSRCPG